ncbi:hypothetical protein [Candidatus Nitrosotenuis cloacae]|uniref:hypothetical protein n=1 Tax=Candidatus Nitrosotenuis cloacae TaxID=1603555 RepID=UPI00227F7F38|nr:hypothetical protein [Candidatus Nitrosotenuis cloacae]
MYDPSELGLASVITAVLTAIGLIIAIIINTVQLRGQKNQLFISNFSEITDHVGDDVTKEYRRWLFYDEEKKTLFEKFKKEYGLEYVKKSNEEKSQYKEIEKAVWHLASRYDRFGFILDQDKEMRKKISDYHGQVISKLWLALEPLIDMREDIERDGAYKYFRKIGRKAISANYSSKESGIIDKKHLRLTAIAIVAGAFITIFYNLFDIWLTPILQAPEQATLKTSVSGVLAIIAGLIIYKYYTKSLKLS